MSSKASLRFPARFIFIGILGMGLFASEGYAQAPGVTSQTLDPATQQLLDQLRQSLTRSSSTQVEEQIQRIVQSSGYILPLAEVYYKLAQKETDGSRVAGYYKSIIEYWPNSAWAQKAASELAPLILMSGGNVGRGYESLLWGKQAMLLTPAKDAAAIGEDPKLLRADVLRSLLQVAHYRNETTRVLALTQAEPPSSETTLAAAFANLRSAPAADAAGIFRRWLSSNPNSDLRPLALLGLQQSLSSDTEKLEVLRALESEFPASLEMLSLKKSTGTLTQQE